MSGLAPPRGLAAASATDDELAFASFGQATELLLADFYVRATAAKIATGAARPRSRPRALSATEHAAALAKLLTDAGQTASVAEDFEFAWPDGTFAARRAAGRTGLEIARPLLGVYLAAAIGVSIAVVPDALRHDGRQRRAAGRQRSRGSRAGGSSAISFPPAVDVETASDAIEAYLG